MAKETATGPEKALSDVTSFVVSQLKAGTSKAAIIGHLADKGVKKEDAERFVHSVHSAAVNVAQKEKLSGRQLPLALLGAVLASVVGGIIWGLITIVTNYEIGFVAVGVGFLAGLAVVKLSGGKKGVQLQVAAVIASLIGILIGKYIFFVHAVGQALTKQLGTQVALSYFSPTGMGLFLGNPALTFGAFDILWVFLAAGVAWQIPKGIGIKH